MCEDDRGQVVTIFFEKIKIWYRNINPKRRLLRKTHARINDDHFVAIANAHAVHPKFADAAQRNNFYFSHVCLNKTRV